MRISYDVKGPRRRELGQAVAAKLQRDLNYLGAPSFAYQMGEYQIDKDGVLQGPDSRELVANLKELHFAPEAEEYDSPLPKEPDHFNREQIITLQMPRQGYSDTDFKNLEKLVASKASLIRKAIGAKELPIIQTADEIEFPWFKKGPKEDLDAYLLLVQGLF